MASLPKDAWDYMVTLVRRVPTAWKHGTGLATTAAAAIPFILLYFGAVTAPWSSTVTSFASLAIAIVEVLLIFPFVQWRADQETIRELTERNRSKLTFVGLAATKNPWIYSIEIRNDGTEHLSECLVKVETIDVTEGVAPKFTMPCVLRTDSQVAGARSGSFNLRPGETKRLRLLRQQQQNRDVPIVIEHEAGIAHLDSIRRCRVHIAGYGSHSPARAVVEMWIVENQDNRLTAKLVGADDV